LLGCLVALAGCGIGPGAAPSAVKLLVTADFGARPVGAQGAPKVVGEETVMSLLERNHHVTTRFGGGFVQSIDGLSGGSEAGRPVDWFYYVNGVEAPKGAAATTVHAGDHVWWDHHDWSQTEDVPAVVGSYPEPFANGYGGQRYPVRVECADAAAKPCQRVLAQLRAVGVPAALSAIGPGGEMILRVLVGPWSEVKREPEIARIEQGPRASGVYARMAPAGSGLTVLDDEGRAVQTLGAGTGIIAAVRQGEFAPTWVVTGTDGPGLEAAAGAFDEASLDGHFAVAVTASGTVPLPAPTTASTGAAG
jgi:hypothetical protein